MYRRSQGGGSPSLRLRAVDTCLSKHGDAGTSDFLTGLMEQHEKMAWMLRAYLRGAERTSGDTVQRPPREPAAELVDVRARRPRIHAVGV
jgi:hypothetical protein